MERRDPNPVELVLIRGEDPEKAHPVDDGNASVARLLEDASVEGQPAYLLVSKRIRHLPSFVARQGDGYYTEGGPVVKRAQARRSVTTKAPLVLPMSSRSPSAPRMRIRAWRRESSGSSRITSQPLRPIVTSALSISITRPVSLPLRMRSAYFLSGARPSAADMRPCTWVRESGMVISGRVSGSWHSGQRTRAMSERRGRSSSWISWSQLVHRMDMASRDEISLKKPHPE